jgi:hypothetical protein
MQSGGSLSLRTAKSALEEELKDSPGSFYDVLAQVVVRASCSPQAGKSSGPGVGSAVADGRTRAVGPPARDAGARDAVALRTPSQGES